MVRNLMTACSAMQFDIDLVPSAQVYWEEGFDIECDYYLLCETEMAMFVYTWLAGHPVWRVLADDDDGKVSLPQWIAGVLRIGNDAALNIEQVRRLLRTSWHGKGLPSTSFTITRESECRRD